MLETSLSLAHLVRRGTPAEHSPIVILAHGYGSNEADLFDLAPLLDPGITLICPRAPLVLGPGSFAWFDVGFTTQGIVADPVEVRHSTARMGRFVAEVSASWQVPASHIIIGGFSQGGSIAAMLLLTQPDLVAGALILSGLLPDEAMADIAPHAALPTRRCFVSHGTADQVIPITHGRGIPARLARLGVAADYHEYPMGHTIDSACLGDMRRWLAAWQATLPTP